MEYLPVFLDLKNKKCLIVGGGEIALRKARLLARANASLHVVSHQVVPELEQLLEQGAHQFRLGDFSPADLDDAVLNERPSAGGDPGAGGHVVEDHGTGSQVAARVEDHGLGRGRRTSGRAQERLLGSGQRSDRSEGAGRGRAFVDIHGSSGAAVCVDEQAARDVASGAVSRNGGAAREPKVVAVVGVYQSKVQNLRCSI